MPECKLCNINPADDATGFCGECKDPGCISGLCKGCGGRFKLTPQDLQAIIALQPELRSVAPQLGMSVVVSHCTICEPTSGSPIIKIIR